MLSSNRAKEFQAGAFLAAVALADAALVAAWLTEALPASFVLGGHGALAASVWLLPQIRRDVTIAIFSTLALLALGPFGAIGLSSFGGSKSGGEPPSQTNAGHPANGHPDGRGNPARAICEQLMDGRAHDVQPGRVRSFASVLADGELVDKQAMLGSLSLNFQPHQLPVLKEALTSEQAAVRVSAAAVFARLRESYRRVFLEGTKHAPGDFGSADLITRAASLAEAARSGMLDEAEAGEARQAALDLLLQARPACSEQDAMEELLCGLLLEQARYEDIEARLGGAGAELPAALRHILMRARMRAGRHDRLPEVAYPFSGKVMRFPIRKPATHARPLLTDPAQAG